MQPAALGMHVQCCHGRTKGTAVHGRVCRAVAAVHRKLYKYMGGCAEQQQPPQELELEFLPQELQCSMCGS